MRQIVFKDKAMLKLYKGITTLEGAVKITLSPKGRNVAIGKKNGIPSVIHDGVTVAKQIELKDPLEQMGASLVREAALKTNDEAGDGTTTAIILAKEIVKQGLYAMQDKGFLWFNKKGVNPMMLKEGMDIAVDAVIQELKDTRREIDTEEEIAQVATISSTKKEVGKIVASALEDVGEDGILDVEEGSGTETTVELTKGMEFDKGYISPYFMTEEDKVVIKNPSIIIIDKSVSSVKEIMPMLNVLTKKKKELLVIADDVTGEALGTFVLNRMKGNLSICAVKAPEFGDRRKDMLKDIAILTGATIISEESGRTLENITLEDFGEADKVICTKDSTQIIGGKGDNEKLEKRIEQLKKEIEETKSVFDKEKLKTRLARLSKGVGRIFVGATTEPEMKDLKERIVDAIGAATAAREEGVVPGGGIALLKAREIIKITMFSKDQMIGADIIYKALSKPIEQILENAGENVEDTLNELKLHNKECGYDIMTKTFGNMFDMGIIDPLKVTRLALKNAASVAFMILTTEVLISEEIKDGDVAPQQPPMSY